MSWSHEAIAFGRRILDEVEQARWAQVRPDGESSVDPQTDTFAAGYEFAISVVKHLVTEEAQHTGNTP